MMDGATKPGIAPMVFVIPCTIPAYLWRIIKHVKLLITQNISQNKIIKLSQTVLVPDLGAISICRIALPDRQKPANPSHPHRQITTITICVQSRNPTANAHGADRMRPEEKISSFQSFMRPNLCSCYKDYAFILSTAYVRSNIFRSVCPSVHADMRFMLRAGFLPCWKHQGIQKVRSGKTGQGRQARPSPGRIKSERTRSGRTGPRSRASRKNQMNPTPKRKQE